MILNALFNLLLPIAFFGMLYWSINYQAKENALKGGRRKEDK